MPTIGKCGARGWVLLIGMIAVCLVAAMITPAPALAQGDKVQGDKGQGSVSRWAMFEDPWLQVVLGVVAIGLAATLAILVARRRR